MIADLMTLVSSDIFENSEFVRDFIQLAKNELSPTKLSLNEEQTRHLLESCIVLSLSKDEPHQKMAYKIAIYLLRQLRPNFESIPFVAELVLTRLGDLPVIRQMIDIDKVDDYFSYFTTPNGHSNAMPATQDYATILRFPEVLDRKIFNQVQIGDNRTIALTDFQSQILRFLRTHRNVAFSAPTSAGKSYVILNYIAHQIFSSPSYCAIYIVPTKALVAEVQGKIVERLKELQIQADDLIVFTGASILNEEEIRETKKKVFVLTQERLQEMMANFRLEFRVDLLVVDEAQQVANEGRGIVVEDAVQELIRKEPSLQKVFISPYVSNVEKFEKIFAVGPDKIETARTTKSPVAQNIFFVSFKKNEGKGYKVAVSLLSQELKTEGTARHIDLDFDIQMGKLPAPIFRMKAWVARNVVNDKEPTLIYCNKPFDCRKVGEELATSSGEVTGNDGEVKDAIRFLKQHVHKDYYLADFLKFGIGYHYGTMPQFVRIQIKELFEHKKIIFLACTSTLLEGVNLPARNLVLYDPRKGSKIPMDTLSIRNLMGRAGRLLQDYYGKIYCINVDDWDSGKDVFEDKQEVIESSSEVALSKKVLELIGYLKDSTLDVSEGVKSMATSLQMKQLLFPGGDFLSSFKERHDGITQDNLDIIKSLLIKNIRKLSLDKSLILKNRSIDPRFQEDLYQTLKHSDDLSLPPFPTSRMYRSLEPVFGLIAHKLLRERNNSFKFYAVLASQWINEIPYKEILDNQISHEIGRGEGLEERARKKRINKVIEDLDDAIENKLKFDYTRGLRCYSDILEKVLQEMGRRERYCGRLSLFLESGASNEKVLFLIGAGLSRNTAVEIFRSFEFGNELPGWTSVTSTTKWLRDNKSRLENRLHRVLFKEVERIIG